MNHNLAQLTESFTIALADRVRQLKRDGVPVIGLQTGDPDFNTPQPIIDAAYEAMQAGATHYSNSRGLPALREAIADRVQRMTGAEYDPATEILVTHGAIHAYHVGLAAILNPGDSVLIPDPSWQTHANMVRVLGGKAVRVAGSPENDFFPAMQAWEDARTEKTVALVLNSPCNPTGMVASREYVAQLVAFAEEHDLLILADEVYDTLLYGVEHTSVAALPGAKARTLLLNSFSKSYAMTGWRIGYLCAPQPIISNALKQSQHTVTNVAEFTQRAALVALSDSAVQDEVAAMAQTYARRREKVLALYDSFGETPIEIIEPQGAFYFFLDARALGIGSNEIAERILNEQRVCVVPGSAYGAAGEGFLRMTTAAADAEVVEGFRRILKWAQEGARG